MNTPYKIFVFEGADGVGKTTLIEYVHRELSLKHKIDCARYAFPGFALKNYFKSYKSIHGVEIKHSKMNEYFMKEFKRELPKMQAQKEKIILVDRWLPSYIVYDESIKLDFDKENFFPYKDILPKNMFIYFILSTEQLVEQNIRSRDGNLNDFVNYKKINARYCELIDNLRRLQLLIDQSVMPNDALPFHSTVINKVTTVRPVVGTNYGIPCEVGIMDLKEIVVKDILYKAKITSF